MSFYSDASLVLIPSGYKDQKVYCAVPTDGAADLVFSRASSATRVASNGLIEKVRTNLVTYSNDFSNAAWTKVGSNTFTAGQADYLGGTNAWKWASNAIGTVQISQNVTTSAASANHSVYAKAGSVSTFNIWVGTAVTFDLSAGTVTAGTGTITSVGNGWYRCSVNRNTVSSTNSFNPYFAAAAANDFVYISFAQTEESDIATDYIATTTAAVSVGPVSGLPRLDYLNSTCPRLLLEPQRTNVANWSEQANQYSKIGATIGSNVAVSPDGYTNADSLIEDSSTGGHAFFNFGLTTFSVQAYTASIFAKKGGRDWFVFSIYDGTQGFNVSFNLNTGVVGTVPSGVTASMVSMGNGWYRCIVTATAAVGTGGLAIYAASADNTTSYAGTNGLAAAYFYGWQLEAGAYATSYIPTLGTSVTRVWDDASKTGITSLIGQTAGTLFVELNADGRSNGTARVIAYLTANGSTDNRVAIQYNASGQIQAIASSGGSTQGSVAYTITGPCKAAFAYNSSGYELFVNGVSRGTFTGSLPTSLTRLDMNSLTGTFDELGGTINQVLIFKNRLSNSDLATLTTL